MTVLMVGGTFNPPHNGHIRMAEAVRDAFGFERIVFVPAHIPPHKSFETVVPSDKRLEMTRLAISGIPYAEVEDWEIRKKGVSYTIDTIKYLSEHFHCQRPGLVIGDDHVPIFHTWKSPESLAARARLIVVRRNGSDLSNFVWPHEYLDLEPDNISSSGIREAIRNDGLSAVKALVPEKVFDYIRNERLYCHAES